MNGAGKPVHEPEVNTQFLRHFRLERYRHMVQLRGLVRGTLDR